jgi:hypothetical protein
MVVLYLDSDSELDQSRDRCDQFVDGQDGNHGTYVTGGGADRAALAEEDHSAIGGIRHRYPFQDMGAGGPGSLAGHLISQLAEVANLDDISGFEMTFLDPPSAVTINDHRFGDTPGGVRDLRGGSAEG